MNESILFFETPKVFRQWLKEHHKDLDHQWIGFYKKASGRASITWPESVDQALCYGWIDGLRKSIDEISYKIRFTPRKPGSHWSAVNIKKIEKLKKAGLIRKAGLEAFSKRKEKNSMQTAYEQKQEIQFETELLEHFRKRKKAWADFQGRSPSYRRQCTWWVMSGKRSETKIRRFNQLVDSCEKGQKVPPLRWQK